MKEVKIESDDKNVQITCPHCGNWEQVSVDESRSKFESIPVIEWIFQPILVTVFTPDDVSINKCSECGNEFEVEWDYDNEFKND